MIDLDKKLAEYADAFDDGFPMVTFGEGRTPEEIADIIDRCLKAKKDVYAIGLMSLKDGIQY